MSHMAMGDMPWPMTLEKERWLVVTPRFFRSIGSVARYNLAYGGCGTNSRNRIRQNSDVLM
ncbi:MULTISPECIES: hypothetical protein [Rhodopirellula]|uniref:hypothetical protein n=1 Tax=Rhodopirellula TaxID=265488 RepID=UPI00257ED3D4|nr:hypothetical protein [Rhodopirellula sp. UBA1907]